MTPSQIKRNLRRLGISQNDAAAAIGKSAAMVSMVLNRQAKSRPILDALAELLATREKKNGNGQPG